MSLFFYLLQIAAMWGCLRLRTVGVVAFTTTRTLTRRSGAVRSSSGGIRMSPLTLQMSTSTTVTSPAILSRVKAVDAVEPTDGPVLVKGWVRTVRKQKTLAFVEVNDGSNLGGIQCVLSFDSIDDATQEGTYENTIVVQDLFRSFYWAHLLTSHMILSCSDWKIDNWVCRCGRRTSCKVTRWQTSS